MVRVCYILSYYSPDYVRTRTLVKALQKADQVALYQARNSSRSIWRYLETLGKLVRIRLAHNPDVYVLGFRGYELYWPIRMLTAGRPLIYDHMMSPYDSLLNESGLLRQHRLLARLVYLYERSILRNADVVLTDTDVHQRYFTELFGLPASKIVAIPVGTDEELFHPSQSASVVPAPGSFELLYYGSFLPLHGVDVILRAAAGLRGLPMHFTLIGGNRIDLSGFHRTVQELKLENVSHLDWVEFEDLPRRIAAAQLGLGGPFGNTGQARRVITSKTFQFLAMARPVIIGAIDMDGGFVDRYNCLVVPQGDENALIEAITWAFHHPAEMQQIGQRGYELYQARYSIKHISEALRKVISC